MLAYFRWTRGPCIGSPEAIVHALAPAKLNGINPEAHLRHVISVIADHPVIRIDE